MFSYTGVAFDEKSPWAELPVSAFSAFLAQHCGNTEFFRLAMSPGPVHADVCHIATRSREVTFAALEHFNFEILYIHMTQTSPLRRQP